MATRINHLQSSIALVAMLGFAASVMAQPTPPVAPGRITFGPGGDLLVTDYADRSVKILSPADLSVLDEFPVDGRPMGLAYDASRNLIYVGNETASRVQVFDPDGTCVSEFATPIVLPNDIAVDHSTGLVYVVAPKDQKVLVFDPAGNWIRDIPAAGQTGVINPSAVALVRPSQPGDSNGDDQVGMLDFLVLLQSWGPCDVGGCPADCDGDGSVGITDFLLLLSNWGPSTQPTDIYISDYGDGFFIDAAIRMYDEQGLFLREVEGEFSRPQSVYAENDTEMFVVASFIGKVVRVDQATGNTIATLGEYGTLEGQMIMPLGIAIDPVTRDVFVASNRTGRIEVFRQGGQQP